MEFKDLIYIVLAILTILSFYFNRTKEAKEDSGLIVRLNTVLENLSSEVTRLNNSIGSLTTQINDFNREVGVLDSRVNSMHEQIDKLTHRVEELERFVYGNNTHE
jgi:peptidoglycan hydrolase CwlO-like protein